MCWEAFRLWNWAQLGFLPCAGGVYDQPERLLRMIEAVQAAQPKKK